MISDQNTPAIPIQSKAPSTGPEVAVHQVINPDSPHPLVLLCDHASNHIPDYLNQLGLSHQECQRHIAWDIGARGVTERLANQLEVSAILARFSRLVTDPNRAPGDSSAIPLHSDGTYIPGNDHLSAEQVIQRMDNFYWPYHRAITEFLVRKRTHHTALPVIVSMHSFTPMLRMVGKPRPWHIGLLWNHDDRLARLVLDHLADRHPDMAIGINQPYSGRKVGHTMDVHGGSAGLPHVDIEIRQDLLQEPAQQDYWAGLLAETLGSVAGHESLTTIKHF